MYFTLKYSNTNTYLIKLKDGYMLFDTAWAGTLPLFYRELGEKGVKAGDIKYLLISHFHPDHMGLAGELQKQGVKIIVAEEQERYIHSADAIFEKEKNKCFVPIDDKEVEVISIDDSRNILKGIGLDGEIIYTPGHSDDSISLILDEGAVFVGDLNPIYELELHKGTEIEKSWNKIFALKPREINYGHAKKAVLSKEDLDSLYGKEKPESGGTAINNASAFTRQENTKENAELYSLVSLIMKYINKGYSLEKIARKTGAEAEFIEDVTRMYLTHQNVGVQGILDRIEIKGK